MKNILIRLAGVARLFVFCLLATTASTGTIMLNDVPHKGCSATPTRYGGNVCQSA